MISSDSMRRVHCYLKAMLAFNQVTLALLITQMESVTNNIATTMATTKREQKKSIFYKTTEVDIYSTLQATLEESYFCP